MKAGLERHVQLEQEVSPTFLVRPIRMLLHYMGST
jgi:hypothetical protein